MEPRGEGVLGSGTINTLHGAVMSTCLVMHLSKPTE